MRSLLIHQSTKYDRLRIWIKKTNSPVWSWTVHNEDKDQDKKKKHLAKYQRWPTESTVQCSNLQGSKLPFRNLSGNLRQVTSKKVEAKTWNSHVARAPQDRQHRCSVVRSLTWKKGGNASKRMQKKGLGAPLSENTTSCCPEYLHGGQSRMLPESLKQWPGDML